MGWWAFPPRHSGYSVASRFDCIQVRRIDVAEFHPVICQHLVEKPRDAPVNVVPADQVVALLKEALCHCRNSGHAAGKNMRRRSTFNCRQVGFQPGASWIGDAGVLISFVLAQLLLDVGGSGKDRHHNRRRWRDPAPGRHESRWLRNRSSFRASHRLMIYSLPFCVILLFAGTRPAGAASFANPSRPQRYSSTYSVPRNRE